MLDFDPVLGTDYAKSHSHGIHSPMNTEESDTIPVPALRFIPVVHRSIPQAVSANSSRPISMRRISLVPA
ncbi:MAG TPA: hypothetical protein PKZ20_19055, partial [Rhodocyclaceae bacterium]|nr:hypothetical protein [Rhodocyclaceae bacterium]